MAPDISTLRPDHFLRFSLHLLAAAFALLLTASSNLLGDDTPPVATGSASALPAEITGTGTIIDAETGQPVSGAKVTIWEFQPTLEDGLPRHHECLSHGDGRFEFTVPTDHPSADDRGIVINFVISVKHPSYILPMSTPQGSLVVATAKPSPLTLPGLPQGAAPKADAARQPAPPPSNELRPVKVVRAQSVTGILQSPDGKPAPGVRIYAFSSAPLSRPPDEQPRRVGLLIAQAAHQAPSAEVRQSFQDDTTTDDQGRFELLVPTAGETLLSSWPAKDFAPSSEFIADKRGDVGAITLKPGRTLTGRIVAADDKPVAGIYMRAWLRVAAPDHSAPAVIQQHAAIWRCTRTDDQGSFAFAPLLPGEYVLEPTEVGGDLSTKHRGDPPPEKHPLPAYFAPQKVILSDNQPPTPLEIRPAPMVQIAGHVDVPLELLDAMLRQSETRTNLQTPQTLMDALRREREGRLPSPAEATGTATTRVPDADELRQFGPTIHGLINGIPYQTKAEIDVQGNFHVRTPRGLTDGILSLHSLAFGFQPSGPFVVDSSRPPQPKWRTDKEKPLVTGEEIPIGKVEADIQGIEIVYPDPPQPAAPAAAPSPRARGAGS